VSGAYLLGVVVVIIAFELSVLSQQVFLPVLAWRNNQNVGYNEDFKKRRQIKYLRVGCMKDSVLLCPGNGNSVLGSFLCFP